MRPGFKAEVGTVSTGFDPKPTLSLAHHVSAQSGYFSLASLPQSGSIYVHPARSNDTAQAHRFRRRFGFGSPEPRKEREQSSRHRYQGGHHHARQSSERKSV